MTDDDEACEALELARLCREAQRAFFASGESPKKRPLLAAARDAERRYGREEHRRLTREPPPRYRQALALAARFRQAQRLYWSDDGTNDAQKLRRLKEARHAERSFDLELERLGLASQRSLF